MVDCFYLQRLLMCFYAKTDAQRQSTYSRGGFGPRKRDKSLANNAMLML